MKFIYSFALGFAAVAVLSCHKDTRDLKSPEPLLLRPVHEDAQLPDATLNQMSLYYFQNQTQKKYVGDFGRAAGTGYQQGILSSTDIASLSAIENIKTYYLAYPGGDVDTLTVDYQHLSDEDARQNDCFCNLPQISVRVNGAVPPIDTLRPNDVPVYLLKK